MSIMELGALGEFLGSIGVIATLVYLAVQIRSNTKATKAQALQEIHRDQREVFRFYREDFEVVEKANAGEELSDKEGLFVWQHVLFQMRMYENQWYQSRLGVLDASLYNGYSRHVYLLLSGPANMRVWERSQSRGFYHPGFVKQVNAMLDDAPEWYQAGLGPERYSRTTIGWAIRP